MTIFRLWYIHRHHKITSDTLALECTIKWRTLRQDATLLSRRPGSLLHSIHRTNLSLKTMLCSHTYMESTQRRETGCRRRRWGTHLGRYCHMRKNRFTSLEACGLIMTIKLSIWRRMWCLTSSTPSSTVSWGCLINRRTRVR